LVRADVITGGPIRAGAIGDLAAFSCESFVQAASEVVTSPDGALEDILLHFTAGSLARPESRYRVTLWGRDGAPHEFVSGDGTVSLAGLNLLAFLDDPILWQVGVETSSGGGDLFQSVCLPRRMRVIDLPDMSEPQADQQSGTVPQTVCDRILSISRQPYDQLLVSLICPGVEPLEYPAMIGTFEGRCVTDGRYPDQLFCTSASPPTGSLAALQVWDSDGTTLFEGEFTVPPPPTTEPSQEPAPKPTKPGPKPTKPSD